jgi:hypothetical protein
MSCLLALEKSLQLHLTEVAIPFKYTFQQCRPPNDGRSSQDGSRERAITATNAASDASMLVARSVKIASSSISHVLTNEQQRDVA